MDCLDVLLSIFHLWWGGWDQIIPPAADVVVEVDQGELVSSTELTQDCLHGLDGLRRNLREERFMLPAYESFFLTCDHRQIVTSVISTWALLLGSEGNSNTPGWSPAKVCQFLKPFSDTICYLPNSSLRTTEFSLIYNTNLSCCKSIWFHLILPWMGMKVSWWVSLSDQLSAYLEADCLSWSIFFNRLKYLSLNIFFLFYELCCLNNP